MTVQYFLDTNILIYAVSKDDARKRKIASELIAREEFGLSAQILAEFYSAATRKIQHRLSEEQAENWLDSLAAAALLGGRRRSSQIGRAKSRRYGISYWDGAIVAAAEALGAPVFTPRILITGRLTARSRRSIHFSISPRNRAFTKTDKQRLQRIRAWPSS